MKQRSKKYTDKKEDKKPKTSKIQQQNIKSSNSIENNLNIFFFNAI
jgi:hypothetical protein